SPQGPFGPRPPVSTPCQTKPCGAGTMKKILVVALAAGGGHAALLAGFVAAYRGDLAAPVCVGRQWVGRAPYEPIHAGFDHYRYHGQSSSALARAPWRPHADIDFPGRQLRILYPAVSWLFSGGDARRLLWVMPAVNLVAIAGLGALGAL